MTIAKTHRQSTLALLLACQGSIVPAITPKILGAAAMGVLAELSYEGYLGSAVQRALDYSFTPFTALGVAISLFLGFHNNASYSRWWEARTLWGTQIIAVRDLIRFLVGVCGDKNGEGDDDEEVARGKVLDTKDWRIRILMLTMAHTHALRAQLRPVCRSDEVPAEQDRDRFLVHEHHPAALTQSHNPASAILLRASESLGRPDTGLDPYSRIHASQLVDRLNEIQTACERIHNTTLPFAYSLLVHRTAFMYVVLSPFAISATMGWWTPVFTAILAYTFFGLDEVARQLNEPFNDEPQCLALSAMCRAVERDICEAVGLPIPPPLQPHHSVLM
jgi:ion channel-forming bestrophin family protein